MLLSFAFLFLGGLFLALLAERLKLPRIIGMLLAGVLLGPYLLDLFDASLLDNSAAFRRMALIIILIKAGLTIDLKDLKKVGRPAFLMSFVPASFEILAYLLFAPILLGMSLLDAALLGSVMAAVSPAVVVPRMVNLIDKGYGSKKSIPQLILAGASLDDIVVIVFFTSFLSMASGDSVNLLSFFNIPISILLGLLVGSLCGLGLLHFFQHVRVLHPVHKILIMLGVSFFLVALEAILEGKIAISGLLAVMAMAAVSPAVVVPRMVNLIDKGYGSKKSIPQLILAGASLDDIVVIVLFTSFLSMASGASVNLLSFFNIPISILLGLLVGGLCGLGLLHFFQHVRVLHPVHKILIMLGLSFFLVALEAILDGKVALSGLLAVMAMAAVLKMKGLNQDSQHLASAFGNIWIGAEVVLFVLVGAAVDIRYLGEAGLPAILLIVLALLVRSLGVYISVSGSQLNAREKVFAIIAYLPKATVQAAIGSVPLAAGLESGKLILSVAVIGIALTAPLGALLMDTSYQKLLTKD